MKENQVTYKNEKGNFITLIYSNERTTTLWANKFSFTVEEGKVYEAAHEYKEINEIHQVTWATGNQVFRVITNLDKEMAYDLAKKVEKVHTRYEPDYIPEGFRLIDEDVGNGYGYYSYEKADAYLSVDYIEYEGAGNVLLSPEHSTIIKEKFHNSTAYFAASDDGITNSLVWYTDEYKMQVSGTIEKNEIYKIAENLKACY